MDNTKFLRALKKMDRIFNPKPRYSNLDNTGMAVVYINCIVEYQNTKAVVTKVRSGYFYPANRSSMQMGYGSPLRCNDVRVVFDRKGRKLNNQPKAQNAQP